jgi:hypothetical protein
MAEVGLKVFGGAGGVNGGAPMASGRWYDTNGTAATGSPGGNSRGILTRVLFGAPCTLNGISVDVTVIGQAASVFRFGIFADASGLPGSRIQDFGTVAADALGANPLTISQAVLAQWYWLCVAPQGQTPTLATVRTSNVIPLQSQVGNTVPGGAAAFAAYYFDTGFSGALPSSAGTPTGTLGPANSPAIWLKAA